MPTIRLTQAAVEKLKPPAKRDIFWDRGLPGFGLRITPSGHKAWVAMYRVHGRSVMETLASFKAVDKVERARGLARKAIAHAAATGEHPTEAKRQRRREVAQQAANTFVAASNRYLRHYQKRVKVPTAKEVERQLRVELKGWNDRPVVHITRQDVKRLLEKIETDPRRSWRTACGRRCTRCSPGSCGRR